MGTTITKVRVGGRKEINNEASLLHFLYRTGIKRMLHCYTYHPVTLRLLARESRLDLCLFVQTTD